MKTTLDLPDALLRDAKATAAMRGESLRDFVAAAVDARLGAEKAAVGRSGWRAAFGVARPADVAAVDRIVSRDFESVDPSEWR
jgi:hypothetical protein